MILTENEKRDVIKFLEAGKPLPEKYRFILFKDDREVELVWNGKTNEVTNAVLPFQTIEQIDEPRKGDFGNSGTLWDTTGRQITGWTNKLIWGDNKLILSSLKNGPMRKEIEAQGGLKLVYIDPPFDVGADFSMDITVGEESFTKKPSVIEEIAYRDTWGKGADSFIAMIYERLKLIHGLLAEDGSIYVHCDWRLSCHLRLILDEIFGKDRFKNEIIWRRVYTHSDAGKFGHIHDTIFFYTKGDKNIWNDQLVEQDESYIKSHYSNLDSDGRRYQLISMSAKTGKREIRTINGKDYFPEGGAWKYSQKTIDEFFKNGLIFFTANDTPRLKIYLDDKGGKKVQSIWTDLFPVNSQALENIDYPTQKPESLIERIIRASSNPGDLVADFFCGSGTTLAVAEKLGRKWIGTDIGRFGMHTSRKRMIGVQRELKKEGKDFRAFEILNVGRYERENFVVVNGDLRAEERVKQTERKEQEFVRLILNAYKAEPVETFKNFVGKKRDRLVAVGPINAPVSSKFVDFILEECTIHGITKVDVLGFDYEMGLDAARAKEFDVDIALKIIPREVFDKKAVEKGQVKFYDVAFVEFEPEIVSKGKMKEVSIKLTDFSVSYNQDDVDEIILGLKPGGSKIVLEGGNLYKVTKDKTTEEVSREVLTKKWSDWIDYWAVDFNFADRKEIVKVEENGEEKEVWTGGYIFDNEWQSFRTKKNRNIELKSAPKELPKGEYKVAVKVVDIFGNDTTRVISVKV